MVSRILQKYTFVRFENEVRSETQFSNPFQPGSRALYKGSGYIEMQIRVSPELLPTAVARISSFPDMEKWKIKIVRPDGTESVFKAKAR